MQEQPVDDAEDGGIGANAEGQCRDGGCREGRTLEKGTQCETDVSPHGDTYAPQAAKVPEDCVRSCVPPGPCGCHGDERDSVGVQTQKFGGDVAHLTALSVQFII